MPDQIFENPLLVAVYDAFDGRRSDLEPYAGTVEELRARTILDVGSGTGCLACFLAAKGLEVTGLEPARAALEVARADGSIDALDREDLELDAPAVQVLQYRWAHTRHS